MHVAHFFSIVSFACAFRDSFEKEVNFKLIFNVFSSAAMFELRCLFS